MREKFTQLQQLLPFTVLKPSDKDITECCLHSLQQLLPFTVLKLYCAAHHGHRRVSLQQLLPFTVLKLTMKRLLSVTQWMTVATALTVYGIETKRYDVISTSSIATLQQLLPFTVLKP